MYTYKVEGKVIRIIKGAIITMKGQKINGLSILLGSLVTSGYSFYWDRNLISIKCCNNK